MTTTKRGVEYLTSRGQTTLLWTVHHGPRGTSDIYWQHGTVPEAGVNGFQPEELLELVAERLRDLVGTVPSRETSLAITNVEQAILWLEERTRDRRVRGVEGTNVP